MGSEEERTGSSTVRLAATLAMVVGIGGLAILTVCKWQEAWLGVPEQVFHALIVSGVLAWTVDIWLKRQLAEDAFRGALGYLLPPELRGELSWIYDQSFLVEKHVQTTHIEHLENEGLVIARTKLRRTVRNISKKTADLRIGLGVEEWMFPGRPAEIREVAYTASSEQITIIEREREEPNVLKVPPHTVKVGAGEKVEVLFEWVETKRDVDSMWLVLRHATNSPYVEVDAPDTLQYTVGFQHRYKFEKRNRLGKSTFVLEGVQLPHQAITIVWAPKQKAADWISGSSSRA